MMKGGDVILTSLQQADGFVKNRPTLVLCAMPPFGDLLVCGISTQLHQAVPGFDETIAAGDPDFALSGLASPSLIRLGFVSTIPLSAIKGRIGKLDAARHRRLVVRLSRHLASTA
jgi:mRNA interferase MazF